SVSAFTGPAISSLRMTPANTANTARISAVTNRLCVRWLEDVSIAVVGRSASISATASPVAAKTGTQDAYTTCALILCTAYRPSASGAEERGVNAFTGSVVNDR